MADQSLEKIDKEILEKVVNDCNFSILLESGNGKTFFNQFIENYPELKKYWTFYECVDKLTASQNSDNLLELEEQCFKEHIRTSAGYRIGMCLNRSNVEALNTAIKNKDTEDSLRQLKHLQKLAFDHLNPEVLKLLGPYIKPKVSSQN